MAELTDAQKVNREVTQKRIATALEALAGTGGRGLPAGGADGDVLVKNGATDYDAEWTNTPKLMANFAPIEETQSLNNYNKRDFLVYNGQLYVVAADSGISIGETLIPGQNIYAQNMGYFVHRINNFLGVGNSAKNYNIDYMTDTIRYTGIYFYNGWDGNMQGTLPFTNAYGLLFVIDNDAGSCVQVAINFNTGKFYRRQYTTSWTNWSEST